ncbi:PEP-CTERM sorting domain-containing protein [Nitrosomonas sp.]|uniref:PEP-CTERM sorting domain-containing protein n=1 Tax=Nitrosomonas sp. TaxID=42353 RepID=UPI0025DD13E2|nr:PEP-CTERM sorting domain-containing protein [Nitrosomonas sp.]MBV6447771.1 hypothetical protein [Nitrosomonas sp.]
MIKKIFLKTALVFSTLAIATSATAAADYGFESGDFTGFSLTGNGSVVSSFSGLVPTEGTYFALLKTPGFDGDGSSTDTSVFGGTTGTILSLHFDLAPFQEFSFNYAFVSEEVTRGTPADDFSAFGDITTGVYFGLRDVNHLISSYPGEGQTGWRTGAFSFMDNSSHSMTMSWVVSNVDDNNVSSYLLIDNIQITTVPESETYAMLLVGLSLIGYMLRNRKTVII